MSDRLSGTSSRRQAAGGPHDAFRRGHFTVRWPPSRSQATTPWRTQRSRDWMWRNYFDLKKSRRVEG